MVQASPLFNGPPPKTIYAYGTPNVAMHMTPHGYQPSPFRPQIPIPHRQQPDNQTDMTPMAGTGVAVFNVHHNIKDDFKLGVSMVKKKEAKHIQPAA